MAASPTAVGPAQSDVRPTCHHLKRDFAIDGFPLPGSSLPKRHASSMSAQFEEAEAHERAGRAEAAIHAYEEALRIEGNTSAAINAAVLYKHQGKLGRARKLLLEAMTMDPVLRISAGRLLNGGHIFGDSECTTSVLHQAAHVLTDVLTSAEYGRNGSINFSIKMF